ncbi:exodeoxyribonuclease VII large subunit, partial [Dietzia cercidiphylli]|nr:exodeoxyribonuclease VII large subunit [Dietzia cercidiphylli]
ATLARGYAVVQSVAGDHDGRVVSSIAHAPPGSQLRIRVSDGALSAAVLGSTPAAGRTATTTAPPGPSTPEHTTSKPATPEPATPEEQS